MGGATRARPGERAGLELRIGGGSERDRHRRTRGPHDEVRATSCSVAVHPRNVGVRGRDGFVRRWSWGGCRVDGLRPSHLGGGDAAGLSMTASASTSNCSIEGSVRARWRAGRPGTSHSSRSVPRRDVLHRGGAERRTHRRSVPRRDVLHRGGVEVVGRGSAPLCDILRTRRPAEVTPINAAVDVDDEPASHTRHRCHHGHLTATCVGLPGRDLLDRVGARPRPIVAVDPGITEWSHPANRRAGSAVRCATASSRASRACRRGRGRLSVAPINAGLDA